MTDSNLKASDSRALNRLPGPGFLPALTGIRALAALLVLGVHATPFIFGGYPKALKLFSRGYLGVDFFFLLSGFIISHVYLAQLAAANARSVRIFLWHRLIRMYPVHLTVLLGLVAMVVGMTALVRPVRSEELWRFGDLPWHLLLVHAWGAIPAPSWNLPSWSISAEWFAYLLFPLLAPILLKIRSPLLGLVFAGVALAMTASTFLLKGWSISDTWVGAPALVRVTGEFCTGALICAAVRQSPPNARPRISGDLVGSAGLALFALGGVFAAHDFLLIVCLATVIWGASTARAGLARTLGGRVLRWIGETSYSLYMTHAVVLGVISHRALNLNIPSRPLPVQLLALVATLALCFATAALMFKVVEAPARRRLRDYLGKLE